MTDTLFVGCDRTDRIGQGDEYRVTLAQSYVQRFVFGDAMQSAYNKLNLSPWSYVISEPPLAGSPVWVVDLRIAHSSVGSAPPGSVAEFYNGLTDLLFFSTSYDVTRIEKIDRSTVQGNRGTVVDAALQAERETGFSGAYDKAKAAVGSVLGTTKTVLIVAAVIAGSIAAIYAVKELRAARAA